MASLLFLLALVAFAGGVALFVADSRERAAKAPGFIPPQDPQAEPLQQPEHPERAPEEPETTQHEPRRPEIEPEPEHTPEPAQTPAHTPEPEPTQKPQTASKKLTLPGAQRRERKAWAAQRGYDFAKTDDLLAGEWHRGAAAGGAAPRDVATGAAYGHTVHFLDLGGTTVVAMSTGGDSAVVVDLRRIGLVEQASSDDLISLGEVEGFELLCTNAGVGWRFVDRRVRTALEQMPDIVATVWLEGEWALAQLTGESTDGWDDVLAPLALIADAARTLPPRHDTPLAMPFPTREMPGEHVAAPDAAHSEPAPVQRPEEPIELPTRITGGARGDLSERELGADDVEAIAGAEHRTDLTRVKRNQKPSSIFDQEEPR